MRVCLTGTHAVGKTTLLTILKEKYPNYDIQLESLTRKAVNDPAKLNLTTPEESEKLISEAYMKYFLDNQDKDFISSRHMIDVLAYSMYLSKKNGNISEEVIFDIEKKVEELKKIKLFDLVLYIPLEFDLPEVEKGAKFREGQEDKQYREDVDGIIKFLLWGYNIPYVKINGSKDERIAKIVELLEKGKENG
jgi:hypothetical protein